jgi:hypothetical protein
MTSTLDTLEPGQSFVYHTSGISLARDRGKKRSAAIVLADEAWQAAVRGEVDLVQRRSGNGVVEYIAVKRRRRDPRPPLPAMTVQERRMQSVMALQSVRPMRRAA